MQAILYCTETRTGSKLHHDHVHTYFYAKKVNEVATDPTGRTPNFKRMTRRPTSHVIFALVLFAHKILSYYLLDVMYVVLVLRGELYAEVKKRLYC